MLAMCTAAPVDGRFASRLTIVHAAEALEPSAAGHKLEKSVAGFAVGA
jgi:hypothetical protein